MTTSQRAKELIEKIQYAAVATVSGDGRPWNAPVFVAYDSNYNFYWGTDHNSQKSKNIYNNDHVFLVLYDSTAPAGKGEGVYIEATAAEIKHAQEIERAHKLLCDRHVAPYWKLQQLQGSAPVRLYKAIPSKIWMNGGGTNDGHYVDIRVEVKLA
jgi:general stress protein 26